MRDCVGPMHRLYKTCLSVVLNLVGAYTVVVLNLVGAYTVAVRILVGTCAVVVCSLLVSACRNNVPPKEVGFQKDATLIITTATGDQHSFDIEIADTEVKRVKGLMNRYKMDATEGMFFIFEREDVQTFWMKNTYLSLDMLFISGDYSIVDIHENAFPLSESLITSEARARYVLELLGGTVKKKNINIGDVVELVEQ